MTACAYFTPIPMAYDVFPSALKGNNLLLNNDPGGFEGWMSTGLVVSDVFANAGSPKLDYTENTTRNLSAAVIASYGNDFVFNRIWLTPIQMPIGFIVEEITREIWVWNSYLYKSITFESVGIDFEYGLAISNADNLPREIPIAWDNSLYLTAYKDGPAFQNSIITFVFDEEERTILVTGFRTLVFDVDPDWFSGISKRVIFHSTVSIHQKLREQRRALSNSSWLDFGFTFVVDQLKSQKVFHTLSFGKDKIIAIPVYDEKLTIASLSDYSIILSESLDFYYYLKNKNLFFIITDHKTKTELKEIETYDFSTKTFTFEFPIREDFNLNDTYVYPVVMSSIKAVSFEEETAELTNWKIDFQEFKSNV